MESRPCSHVHSRLQFSLHTKPSHNRLGHEDQRLIIPLFETGWCLTVASQRVRSRVSIACPAVSLLQIIDANDTESPRYPNLHLPEFGVWGFIGSCCLRTRPHAVSS